jgi:hypothetical protein
MVDPQEIFPDKVLVGAQLHVNNSFAIITEHNRQLAISHAPNITAWFKTPFGPLYFTLYRLLTKIDNRGAKTEANR